MIHKRMKIWGKKEENTKKSTKDNIENKNQEKAKIKLTKMQSFGVPSKNNSVLILSWIFGCGRMMKKKIRLTGD